MSPFAFFTGLLLLALAPVFRGGNRYVALIGLEWLALLVLLLLALPWFACRKAPLDGLEIAPLSRAEWVLVLSPLWAALLFLTPLPISLWAALPGHATYSYALDVAWRPMTLTPDATFASLLAGIPVVAAFALARTATPAQFRVLVPALVIIALVQAVWGLLQVGPFKELYFDVGDSYRVVGSFGNANHFANFITMTLPLAVFQIWQAVAESHSGPRKRQPLAVVFWLLVLFVLAAAVLVSRSRTGAATALLVTSLAALLLLHTVSKPSQRWYLAGAAALLLVVGLSVGIEAILIRMGPDHLGDDISVKWTLISSTWRAALAFWPVGAGPGSFAAVYPQFQPPGLPYFVEHAHSDFVQLLMELGALFVLLAGLAAWLMLRQGVFLWQQTRTTSGQSGTAKLQLCCALGLLAVLLHSWLDFNLRIPANAMLAACLLGAFMRRDAGFPFGQNPKGKTA